MTEYEAVVCSACQGHGTEGECCGQFLSTGECCASLNGGARVIAVPCSECGGAGYYPVERDQRPKEGDRGRD